MPRTAPLPFSLRPHPGGPAPAAAVRGTVRRAGGRLVVRYLLMPPPAGLRLPPPAAPGPADGLWRETCLELFVAAGSGAAYREFNFAPSGRWAAYAFSGYRAPDAGPVPAPPRCQWTRAASGALALRAELPAAALPRGPWRIGISAVLEAADGSLSYWALRHPAARPDFHDAGGFALLLAE